MNKGRVTIISDTPFLYTMSDYSMIIVSIGVCFSLSNGAA